MDKIRIDIALLFCLTLSFILPVQAQDTSDSNRYNTQYSYDSMGNITSLSRNGLLDDCGTGDSSLYHAVIPYLNGQPHSHSKNADYIYGRQWNVMKRFGYDYLESPTGTVFR